MRISVALALAAMSVASSSALAQADNSKFWVAGEIRQGMSEAQFEKYTADADLEVTKPFSSGMTKSVKVGENTYWLGFCDGLLSYASWTIDTNEKYLKSMNQRVNVEGFKLASFDVSSGYSDATNTDMNEMALRFEHNSRDYSVIYRQYGMNSQVTYEDSNHDDSHSCEGDA